MKLLLDILQGAGVAAAAGLRPFLPALAAGGLAAGDVGVDFEGTEFSFLESPWFLLAMAAALVVSVLGRRYFERGTGEAMLAGISIGMGALLFAATLDDRHDTWWYGLIAGAVIALLAEGTGRSLMGRVRERFIAQGDKQAAAALPLYLEGAALATAVLSVLLPPLSLVAVGFVLALRLKSRGSGGEKFAGLRTLR